MGVFRTHIACKAALRERCRGQFLYIIDENKRVVIVISRNGMADLAVLGRVGYITQDIFDELVDFIDDSIEPSWMKKAKDYYHKQY